MPFVRLRGHVLDLLHAYGGAVWAYELVERHVSYIKGRGPQHNTYAAQTYGKIIGTLLGVLEEKGISRYLGVPVGTVKKAATGKGNAGKEAMLTAAKSRFDISPDREDFERLDSLNRSPVEGEDEADALWVAETARLLLPEGWARKAS